MSAAARGRPGTLVTKQRLQHVWFPYFLFVVVVGGGGGQARVARINPLEHRGKMPTPHILVVILSWYASCFCHALFSLWYSTSWLRACRTSLVQLTPKDALVIAVLCSEIRCPLCKQQQKLCFVNEI